MVDQVQVPKAGGFMKHDTEESIPPDVPTPPGPRRFSYVPDHDPYPEPEPYIDSSSRFEQDDREDGMGVDDQKTYHRTEK